jgi:hypothetical protein
MNLPGLESSPESSISTAKCSTKTEGNKQPVPRDSAGYADKIQDIHLYADVCNWLLLCIYIYLKMHRTEVISNFNLIFYDLNHILSKPKKT